MIKSLGMMLAVLFVVNVHANTHLDAFNKRFSLVKNDSGEVAYIRMNRVGKFSLNPYIERVFSDIKAEIKRLQNKSSDIEDFLYELEQSSDKSPESQENILAIRDSLYNLKNINVENLFSSIKKKGVLKKFKDELKKALMLFDISVIASTEDPKYFFKQNITYQVVERAINFAKSRFDTVPVLNLVSFIMVKVHDLVLEQREFHQNMLLHYLQNVNEIKLGLTKKEADKVFSSIYEAKIALINIPESRSAANNWERYGLNKFYQMVRGANNRLRREQGTLDEVGNRINFAFFNAVEKGEKVVKNLIHRKHTFSSKMATAYNYDRPNKVKRFRTLLNLGQVGLGFLTLPNWLKSQVEKFIESYYVEQKLMEGALVAHFEMQGNYVMAKNIKDQMINPYLQ